MPKPKKNVILQPMFFPWIGVFEQIRLADIYVHYTDVQLPQGRSFINRVQIKTPQGSKWLTVPVQKSGRGLQLIRDVLIDDSTDWRAKHLKTLEQNYHQARYFKEMMTIVKSVFSLKTRKIAELDICGLGKISRYFGLECRFLDSSKFPSSQKGSEHLKALMLKLKGKVYITGWGAANYLDHQLFEKEGLKVEYMDYKMRPYGQSFGKFTPYVSILDLIAHEGKKGKKYINSPTISWQKFLQKKHE